MNLNWDRIKDGETFQSLMNTLIIFEDHKAKIFGRKGKDAAIDAISGDGTIVYQHKLRSTQNEVISAALKDLDRIKEYRKPEHKHYHLWKDVKKWCLTTNVDFNPQTDLANWNKKVVAAFKKEGFDEIDIWYKSKIETKLVKYPEIQGAFFEGKNRIFFSLQEEDKILRTNEIFKYGLDSDFIGREKESKQVEQFFKSNNHLVLPVIGNGGVGKTRFSFEVGLKILDKLWGDVYWVNIEEMEISNAWFNAIIPGRNTLLIIDKPTNPYLLKRLFTQISLQSGNTQNWKAIIATRTSKDSIINILKDSKNKILAKPITLNPLEENNAEFFSLNLLKKSKLNHLNPSLLTQIAKDVSKKYNRYPIWIIYAIHLLETKGHTEPLPEDEWELADEYLSEITNNYPNKICDKNQFIRSINWIALYQPLNIEDVDLLEFLKIKTDIQNVDYIKDTIDNLFSRGFIIKRGRLREIKPDVMRDYILINWLLRKKSDMEEYVLFKKFWSPSIKTIISPENGRRESFTHVN